MFPLPCHLVTRFLVLGYDSQIRAKSGSIIAAFGDTLKPSKENNRGAGFRQAQIMAHHNDALDGWFVTSKPANEIAF
jgi:hypothetical protein